MQFMKMIIRFDKIIRGIVNGIKKGVDLFKEIISGKGLKRIIEDFISAVQSLPEKVMYILNIDLSYFYTQREDNNGFLWKSMASLAMKYTSFYPICLDKT
jgi:hypothetical protein